jgi:hypothetical protein
MRKRKKLTKIGTGLALVFDRPLLERVAWTLVPSSRSLPMARSS